MLQIESALNVFINAVSVFYHRKNVLMCEKLIFYSCCI